MNDHRSAHAARRLTRWLAILTVVALGVLSAPHTSTALTATADAFLAAEAALERGDRAAFATLAEAQRDTPLYPYLLFADLTRELEHTPDARIEQFLTDYPDTPLAGRLRVAYLRRLADAERWADYARIYQPDESSERQCLYLRALIETDRAAVALPQIEALWLSGQSRPQACDPVFVHWKAAGELTTARLWARIRLALEAKQLKLTRYLGQQLPDDERTWLDLWLKVEQTPNTVLDASLFDKQHPQRAAIIASGLATLVRTDPAAAQQAVAHLEPLLAEDPAARERAHSAIGRALAESGDRLGLDYWDALTATADNLPEQERRLRAAIALQAWDRLATWIERMPEGEIKRERWLYWHGVAQEALGQLEAARATFTTAAQERSFWGFMAADRLDLPYNLAHRPVPVTPEQLHTLAQDPAYRRILALDQLGRDVDVRREWRTLAQRLDPAALMAAARLAHERGWHDQAIIMLARSGYWDDLEIRFPLAYRDVAAAQAQQIGIEPEWIQAVMRQESVFAPTIASPAGAVGLMQLLPSTAADIAAELKLPPLTRWSLLDPELNITLGSSYLAQMRDQFGHIALATAAYNAGPGRVRQWLPDHTLAADLWIVSIPFTETRRYVERVLSYRVLYAARLGLEPERLRDILPPLHGRDFWDAR